MQSQYFDSLFVRAKNGDYDAYWKLYEEFVRRANIVIKSTIKNTSNYVGITEDFCGMIDDLYFKIIKEFVPEKGSFSAFINSVIRKRLIPAVRKEINLKQMYIADINFDDVDINSIEHIADPHQKPISAEIALKEFKLKIASPNTHKTQEERLKDKILLLEFAGFSYIEMTKLLKVPYSSLRRIAEEVRTDKDLKNIKLDIK